jgi:hypothetical protein
MDGIITRAVYKYRAPIKRVAYIACPPFGSPVADFVLHPQINSQQFMSSVHFPYVPTAQFSVDDAYLKNDWDSKQRICGLKLEKQWNLKRDWTGPTWK